jgi:hypothetical protein
MQNVDLVEMDFTVQVDIVVWYSATSSGMLSNN